MNVCFVALKAAGALGAAEMAEHIGGAEVQQALLARALLRRGHRVSFVVYAAGPHAPREIDGIRLIPAYARREGLPGVRFLYPRWWKLDAAMRQADADVYVQRGAGVETGQAAACCRRRGRAMVFAVGSDSDCAATLHYLRSARARRFYRYGLTRATQVVAQTQMQREALRSNFGVDATVIRSIAAPAAPRRPRTPGRRPRLLWIGRFSYEKRPEWLVELALLRPEWDFDVVGGANTRDEAGRAMLERSRKLSNVRLHGAVALGEMERFYAEADLVLCTSQWEGFPNTLLEGWARGVPCVSTVNPDGVIARYGLGAVASTPADLAAAAAELLDDAAAHARASQACRRYVGEHHALDAVVDSWERVLGEACTRANTGGAAANVGEAEGLTSG